MILNGGVFVQTLLKLVHRCTTHGGSGIIQQRVDSYRVHFIVQRVHKFLNILQLNCFVLGALAGRFHP